MQYNNKTNKNNCDRNFDGRKDEPKIGDVALAGTEMKSMCSSNVISFASFKLLGVLQLTLTWSQPFVTHSSNARVNTTSNYDDQ